MGQQQFNAGIWLGRVMLGLLAALALAAVASGLVLYGYGIEKWIDDGYVFKGFGLIDWLLGLAGAAIVGAGLLLAGVFLRLLRRRWARLASLCLAVASACFIIATFFIYSQTDTSSDSIEVVLLRGISILGLFVVCLPPFLHWYFARRQPVPADVTAAARNGAMPEGGRE